MGRLTSPTMGWRPLPFWPPGAFLRNCSREGLLDLENEEHVVSLSFIWAELSSSLLLAIHLGVPVHRGQTPAAQPGAHLSPASNPPCET